MIRMPPEIGKELFGSEEACDLMGYDGKVEMVLWHENLAAVTDSIGSCRFMHGSYYAQYPIPELLGKLNNKKEVNSIKYHDWISASTGMKIDYKKLLKIGHRIVNLERALNTRFGIRRKDDRLPKKFSEPIPKGPRKGQSFPKKQLEKMLDEYYNRRGWDLKTGLLKKSELIKLDMKDVFEDLNKKKLVK
jgi:aldehyde:ferredoxin oxidoreductase